MLSFLYPIHSTDADQAGPLRSVGQQQLHHTMLQIPPATGLQHLSRLACAALTQQHLPFISHLGPESWLASAAATQAWRLCSSQQQHHQTELSDDNTEQVVDKQQMLRESLRKTHAAEVAMSQVLAGQQLVLHNRPDAVYFADQEKRALADVQQLLPRYRVRPSALLSVLQGAGLAAGAAAALAPPAARNAVIAALQETLTELYNNQLRLLREAGLSDEAPDVRAVVVKLRNLERAAEGTPPPPDIMSLSLQSNALASVGVTGVLGAVVKAVADAAVAASGKV